MVYLGWKPSQEPDGPGGVVDTESLQGVGDEFLQGVSLQESSHNPLPPSVLHSQCHRRHFATICLA